MRVDWWKLTVSRHVDVEVEAILVELDVGEDFLEEFGEDDLVLEQLLFILQTSGHERRGVADVGPGRQRLRPGLGETQLLQRRHGVGQTEELQRPLASRDDDVATDDGALVGYVDPGLVTRPRSQRQRQQDQRPPQLHAD